jgi:2-polyprenyl-6-methoxyphenol hydroxylase-like FAD-dependent oxidoreductase
VEDGKWQVTLFGYIGDHPPHDDEGFLKFAEQLASPDIYEALQEATPLTDIKIYNVKEEVRRHYEKLQRFPEGLIVVGDAACSFDPVFGQGMTVAAKEALALSQLLQKSNGRLAGFPKKFHKRIARIIDIPWLLATSEIRRLPQVGGKRPLWLKCLHWYNGNIFELSATVPEVYTSFLKVMHLTTGPQALFHPKIVWRVLKHSLRRKPGAARATAAQPANVSLGD